MANKIRTSLAVLAVLGMVPASPAFAAGATRSAESLPLVAAAVGSVPYSTGVEETWKCVRVKDEALNLDKEYVRVDEAGRVVVDPQGAPFRCRPPAEAYKGGNGGFPFEILLGILGVGGLIAALAGTNGGNDSPG